MSKRTPRQATKQGVRRVGSRAPVARSKDEARVWKALEDALQDVKPVIKREKEGELISGDVLNFRLRGWGNARTAWA